ncbi:olfactory receptor 11A1-like [Dendropsophus ebraccatus]|uniref:olfactory receptor 11A1-like n=1 Tax=Dendropsophus ebraccatus TaxID=150705 RepID=UPI0038313B45
MVSQLGPALTFYPRSREKRPGCQRPKVLGTTAVVKQIFSLAVELMYEAELKADSRGHLLTNDKSHVFYPSEMLFVASLHIGQEVNVPEFWLLDKPLMREVSNQHEILSIIQFYVDLPRYTMNKSFITEIVLRGFGNLQEFKVFFIFICLLIYTVTIMGNLIIILMVATSYRLQSPMFFFLGHLSFSDILVTSNVVPVMVSITLTDGGSLFLMGCIAQFFLFGSLATTECLLLTAMSYDRYLAICYPLHYATIMDHKLCIYLVLGCWSLGFVLTLIPIFLIQTLWFCGPNVIDHFFCDFGPLLELSCSDVSIVKYEVLLLSGIVTTIPFVFIVVTYCYIFVAIMKITSATGRKKTFSTCSSHLAVVCTYYGALFVIYVVPRRGYSTTVNKALSFMYTVITPLFNPIIYGLRNREIKMAVQNYLCIEKI